MSARQIRESAEEQRHDGEQHEGRKNADHEREEQRHREALRGRIESKRSLAAQIPQNNLEVHRECDPIDLCSSQHIEHPQHRR